MASESPQWFIGTAGWSYRDWENAVYPPAKSSQGLRAVARYLDCVEIDSSFYHPPAPRTASAWAGPWRATLIFSFLPMPGNASPTNDMLFGHPSSSDC